MGNRRARAFASEQADAADWERVRTEVRPAAADVHARGIGGRRLQLIVCPSFGEPRAWEVREGPGGWGLFRSRVVAPWPAVQLAGYDLVPIDPAALAGFYGRVVGLALPIGPDLGGSGGADGTVTQLAVFGDSFAACRFQWWSEPPAQWRPLADLAAEMLAVFSAAD